VDKKVVIKLDFSSKNEQRINAIKKIEALLASIKNKSIDI